MSKVSRHPSSATVDQAAPLRSRCLLRHKRFEGEWALPIVMLSSDQPACPRLAERKVLAVAGKWSVLHASFGFQVKRSLGRRRLPLHRSPPSGIGSRGSSTARSSNGNITYIPIQGDTTLEAIIAAVKWHERVGSIEATLFTSRVWNVIFMGAVQLCATDHSWNRSTNFSRRRPPPCVALAWQSASYSEVEAVLTDEIQPHPSSATTVRKSRAIAVVVKVEDPSNCAASEPPSYCRSILERSMMEARQPQARRS